MHFEGKLCWLTASLSDWLSGSTAPEPEEEEAGEEAEEEELESVRVSETEFNFLDYIKR